MRCWLYSYSILGYSRKKNRGGGRLGEVEKIRVSWGIPQRNNICNFQGLIKNEIEIPRVTKRKNNVEFPRVLVSGLGISKGSNLWNFVEFPGVELCFLWNLQG